jgi:two-component sensor histidine kinase
MSSMATFEESPARLSTAEEDHRISNSLSVISSLVRLKATDAKIDDVRQILLDVAGRIDTVARLHRLLARSEATAVPLGRFLGDVCAAMMSIAANDGRLRIAIECPDELTVPANKALSLGLITAELCANSIKYAHPTGVPTFIEVACRDEQDGTATFLFEDDGIGFPEGFDPTRNDSLGMKILDSLSAQLHGLSQWQDLGVGLRYLCRFPLRVSADEQT